MTAPFFRIRFWGVRGSMPTPGPRFIKTGGNTSCISVETDDTLVILDAGSGLRELCDFMPQKAKRAHFLLSHYHWDHLLGFPGFAPLFDALGDFDIYGLRQDDGGAESALRNQFSAPHFPVPYDDIDATLRFHPVGGGDSFEIGPLKIETLALHHPNGALGYRLTRGDRSLVYALDHEHSDEERHKALELFSKDCDILVYDATFEDAQYAEFEGWGHSTWQEGIKLGERAGVKDHTILCHHDPSRDDQKAEAISKEIARMKKNALLACEGLVIDL